MFALLFGVNQAQALVDVSTSLDAKVDVGATSAGQVSGNTSADLDVSVSSPAQVSTEAELKSYTEAVSKNDASVEAVTASANNEVVVTFERSAKLFGFIPVTIKENVEVVVNEQGEESVSISKSWWSFLTSADLRSDELSTTLESKLNSRGSLSTEATLSASAKAQVVADIQASAQAVYGANVIVE